MIIGVNKVYVHAGREYHLQAEDLGTGQACFEIRVYDRGTVLWHKRIPYQEILDRRPARQQLEQDLRSLMEKTIQTVQAAIARGKIAV